MLKDAAPDIPLRVLVRAVAGTRVVGARVCPVALVRHVLQPRLCVVAVDGAQGRGTTGLVGEQGGESRNGTPAWRSARPWGLNEDTNA